MLDPSTLALASLGFFLLIILFHFLVGTLRGFRKSLVYFVAFVIMLILFIIITNPIVNTLYEGGGLYGLVSEQLPEDVNGVNLQTQGSFSEAVTALTTGSLESLTTVEGGGEAATDFSTEMEAIENILHGSVKMVIRIAVLMILFTVGTLFWSIITWIVWMTAFRGSKEERKKRPKRRLIGGGIGAAKGFVYALIAFLPIAVVVGIVNQIDADIVNMIPESNEIIIADDIEVIPTVFEFSKQFEQKVGWAYKIVPFSKRSVDDLVVDSVLNIKNKNESGIYLRQEIYTFIDIVDEAYVVFDLENIDEEGRDYTAFLSEDPDDIARVKNIFTLLSKSKIVTKTLANATNITIAKVNEMAAEGDSEAQAVFEEFDTEGINEVWWENEISNVGVLYESIMNLGLDIDALADDDMAGAIDGITKVSVDALIDSLFDSDLLIRTIDAGLGYGISKINENEELIEDIDEVALHYTSSDEDIDNPVAAEFKNITKLITIFQESNVLVGNKIVIENLTVGDIEDIIDSDLIADSYLINKTLDVATVKGLEEMVGSQETELGDFDFDPDANFSWQKEIGGLVEIISIIGGGSDTTVGEFQEMFKADPLDAVGVPQINDIVDDENDKIWSDGAEWEPYFIPAMLDYVMVPQLQKTLDDQEIDAVVSVTDWQAEFQAMAALLTDMVGSEATLSEVTNLAGSGLEGLTVGKIHDVVNDDVIWNSVLLNDMLSALLEKQLVDMEESFVTQADIDAVTSWRAELRGMVEIMRYVLGDEASFASMDDIGTSITLGSLQDIAEDDNNLIWVSVLIPALLDKVVVEALSEMLDGEEVNVSSWQNELSVIVNIMGVIADEDPAFEIASFSDEFDGASSFEFGIIDELTNETYETSLPNDLSNIENSVILRAVLGMALDGVTQAGHTSAWTTSEWNLEMLAVRNILDAFMFDGEATSDDVLDLDGMDFSGAITMLTLETIADEVENSTIIQYQIAPTFADLLEEPTLPLGFLWDEELSAMVDILEELATLRAGHVETNPVDYEINLNALDFANVNFGLLDKLINVQVGEVEANIEMSTLIQHQLTEPMETLANTANNDPLDVYVLGSADNTALSEYWTVELSALIAIIKAENPGYTSSTPIDITSMVSSAASFDGTFIAAISDNIYEATILQHIMKPIVRSLESATIQMYLDEMDWDNNDWDREMDCLAGVDMTSSNTWASMVIGDVYGLAGGALLDQARYYSTNSYLLQSVLVDVLVMLGVQDYNGDLLDDAIAFAWSDITLTSVGGGLDASTTNANSAWQEVMDTVSANLAYIGGAFTGSTANLDSLDAGLAADGTIAYDVKVGMILAIPNGDTYLTGFGEPSGTFWTP